MTNTKSPAPSYHFTIPFSELNILAPDGTMLNGLLFKSNASKGLLFYLHGGGHSLGKWGNYANIYTDLGYDVFMLDYRGFGKSGGSRPSEKQLYGDVQAAYDEIKKRYSEDRITILGYSFGTAPATMLAAANHPRWLILQAPYYNGEAAVKENYPALHVLLPSFVLQYKLPVNTLIRSVKAPITIFHGTNDSTFNIRQSYALQKLFKPGDELFVLPGQGHNNFTENRTYLQGMASVLSGKQP